MVSSSYIKEKLSYEGGVYNVIFLWYLWVHKKNQWISMLDQEAKLREWHGEYWWSL